jgi:hypothetical protein
MLSLRFSAYCFWATPVSHLQDHVFVFFHVFWGLDLLRSVSRDVLKRAGRRGGDAVSRWRTEHAQDATFLGCCNGWAGASGGLAALVAPLGSLNGLPEATGT